MCAAFISPLPAFYIIRQSSLSQALRVTLHHCRYILELGAAHTIHHTRCRFVCVPSACEGERRGKCGGASKSEQARKCLAPICIPTCCTTYTIEVPIQGARKLGMIVIRV